MRAVTQAPDSQKSSTSRPEQIPSPGKTTLVGTAIDAVSDAPAVQRKAIGGAASDGTEDHAAAARGVDGATGEFPHRRQIESLFGVPITARAAIGGAASAACADMGATAYARGDQVAFGSAPDLRLAAHEAAHTVQQRQGIQLDGGFGRAGDTHECLADQAADRVVRGESAAHLFGGGAAGAPGAAVTPAGVQRQVATPGPDPTPGPGAASTPGPAQTPATSHGWQEVVATIQGSGASGAHDYRGAMTILEGLDMADMLRALEQVWTLGQLDAFFTAAGARGSARARSAFQSVRLAHKASGADRTALNAFNQTLKGIPVADQVAIVTHIAQVAGQAGNELLAEGVAAAIQAASTPMPAAVAAATTPVGPGGWNPPGQQPIPFYVGNEAHVAIALAYVAAHAGERVFTNVIPFSTILGQTPGARPSAVDAANLALKPDIANITLHHLYEIKPAAQLAEAQAKLTLYLGIFNTAGVPMAAGPQTAAGTAGVVPAPGGYYMYESPLPGVILYQYRRGQYQPQPETQPQLQPNPLPVPVPVPTPVPGPQPTPAPNPQPGPQPQPQRQPDDNFWHRMEVATGLTGTALVIYLIISEGSRVIPVRNLVPVP
jgi:hypothetical protein